ncbi:hypothetical protein AWC35_04445 [Gibbsiella quercinecans]|uniref:Uncharacterized protein n=1 Tax=Gibbsiella quercinecans TaxID=929813 RepID=A0A250AXT9_9GAMM|nr:hypothetical protein AWC35_04445 [Gibbsiella quercinecans]RLM14903.1 hypothetical protein BIY30_00205 [Gibbsiella quercinecans]
MVDRLAPHPGPLPKGEGAQGLASDKDWPGRFPLPKGEGKVLDIGTVGSLSPKVRGRFWILARPVPSPQG